VLFPAEKNSTKTTKTTAPTAAISNKESMPFPENKKRHQTASPYQLRTNQ